MRKGSAVEGLPLLGGEILLAWQNGLALAVRSLPPPLQIGFSLFLALTTPYQNNNNKASQRRCGNARLFLCY